MVDIYVTLAVRNYDCLSIADVLLDEIEINMQNTHPKRLCNNDVSLRIDAETIFINTKDNSTLIYLKNRFNINYNNSCISQKNLREHKHY